MHIRKLLDITGNIVIVTGASSGIGYAIAEGMAEAGAIVILCGRDLANLHQACVRLERQGHKVESEQVDVGEIEDVHQLVRTVMERHGKIDAVFANAGISAGPGPFTEKGCLERVTLAEWERILRVNLTGVLATIQAAASVMKRQQQGRIIATASTASFRGDRMIGYAYAASKAAVLNIVRQSAIELAQHQILVNGIAPGPFKTNIGNGRMHDGATEKRFAETVPLGRIGCPHEIKGAALLLASPAASFMTGTVIAVDGGSLAW